MAAGLTRMKEHGNVLLTGAEKTELGILVFDVTSAPASFVAENSELVAKFLKITADANAMWADETKHAEMLPVIAKDAGMDEAGGSGMRLQHSPSRPLKNSFPTNGWAAMPQPS